MLGLYIAECKVATKIKYLSGQHDWAGDLPDIGVYLNEIFNEKSLKACHPLFVTPNGYYIGVIRMFSSGISIEYSVAWLFVPKDVYVSPDLLRNKLQALQSILNKNEISEQECISIEKIDDKQRLVVISWLCNASERVAYRRIELTDYSWSEMFQWLYQDWLFNHKLVFLIEMDSEFSFSSSLMDDITNEGIVEYQYVHLTKLPSDVCLRIGNREIKSEETPCILYVEDVKTPVVLNVKGHNVSSNYTLHEIVTCDFGSTNIQMDKNDFIKDISIAGLNSKDSYVLNLPYEVKGKQYFAYIKAHEEVSEPEDPKFAGYKIDKIQGNQIYFKYDICPSFKYKIKNYIMFCVVSLLLGVGIGWMVEGKTTYRKMECDEGHYYGETLKGIMSGKGILYYNNGLRYDGDWKEGLKSGSGILLYPNGDRYEGEFHNDKIHGRGVLKYRNGDVFCGQWINGLKAGEGILRTKRGNIYQGVWSKDSLYKGTMISDSNKYVGSFSTLSPNGFGIYYYRNGMRYVGNWNFGRKNGLGTLYHKDGKIECGQWDNGILLKSDGHYIAGDSIYGIDVSYRQENIDWDNLMFIANKNGSVVCEQTNNSKFYQPVFFALIKATEGSTIKDSYFERNFRLAKEHGIVRGAYHFLSTKSPISSQITNYTSHVKLDRGDFPPILDLEIPEEVMWNVGVDSVLNMALEWLKQIEFHYKRRPIIYTFYNYKKDYLNRPEFKKYDYWLARYAELPPYSEPWVFWQFTDKGKVLGIKGKVDVNVFNGTYSDLNKYINNVDN